MLQKQLYTLHLAPWLSSINRMIRTPRRERKKNLINRWVLDHLVLFLSEKNINLLSISSFNPLKQHGRMAINNSKKVFFSFLFWVCPSIMGFIFAMAFKLKSPLLMLLLNFTLFKKKKEKEQWKQKKQKHYHEMHVKFHEFLHYSPPSLSHYSCFTVHIIRTKTLASLYQTQLVFSIIIITIQNHRQQMDRAVNFFFYFFF